MAANLESEFWPLILSHFLMTTDEIILKSGKTTIHIPTDAIVQVAGWGNYSRFWLRDGRRLVSAYTLKVYQNVLPAYFLRVHRGSLVNGYCIVSQIGERELLLTDGNRIEVSRRKADAFQAWFAELIANKLMELSPD